MDCAVCGAAHGGDICPPKNWTEASWARHLQRLEFAKLMGNGHTSITDPKHLVEKFRAHVTRDLELQLRTSEQQYDALGKHAGAVADKVRFLELQNTELTKALLEAVEAIENCDRHVGLLGGERGKLERAKATLQKFDLKPKEEGA